MLETTKRSKLSPLDELKLKISKNKELELLLSLLKIHLLLGQYMAVQEARGSQRAGLEPGQALFTTLPAPQGNNRT